MANIGNGDVSLVTRAIGYENRKSEPIDKNCEDLAMVMNNEAQTGLNHSLRVDLQL